MLIRLGDYTIFSCQSHLTTEKTWCCLVAAATATTTMNATLFEWTSDFSCTLKMWSKFVCLVAVYRAAHYTEWCSFARSICAIDTSIKIRCQYSAHEFDAIIVREIRSFTLFSRDSCSNTVSIRIRSTALCAARNAMKPILTDFILFFGSNINRAHTFFFHTLYIKHPFNDFSHFITYRFSSFTLN